MQTVIGILIGLLLSLLLWWIAKKIWQLVQYVVFQSIVDKLVIKIVDEEEDEDGERFKTYTSYSEDDLLEDKNLKKEQMRAAERMNQQENEFKQGTTKRQKRIVGLASNAIVGKWTAKIAQQMMSKLQNIDPQELQDLGYFRAMENAKNRATQKEINQSGSKGGGGRGV